jgi:hypothetical protein
VQVLEALIVVIRLIVGSSARTLSCLRLAVFHLPSARSRSPLATVLGTWSSLLGTLLCLAATLIGSYPTTAAAAVRITDDRGGNIGIYWSRYMALRDSGEQVVIDGTCSSACTIVLGIVPHDRICVTPNAALGFHAAWRPGFLGFKVINMPATRTLLNFYPNPIRQWIARNGGLGLDMMYLSGPELFAMYRQCQ